MHIGLIGGIGPAASAARGTALDLTIAHADAPTLLQNQERGDMDAQVGIFRRLTHRLQAAGAATIAITSIAGHFCIDALADAAAN